MVEYNLKIPLDSFSLRQLIEQKLLKILNCQTIPLYLLTAVVYRCTLPPFLSVKAWEIIFALVQESPCLEYPFILDFTVTLPRDDWLDFHLSLNSLAIYLQQLPLITPISSNHDNISTQIETPFFPLQYAHARCCSLLRLAHQQGLIPLQNLHFNQFSIPWLNLDKGIFLLVHQSEKNLIQKLISVVDALSSPRANWLSLGNNLTQAFLDFHSCCPICGKVASDTPDLALARLGLIALTQFLLMHLLQAKLHIKAPVVL